MAALDEIAAERKRQIEIEGWTPEHDDGHLDRSLGMVASCYAYAASVGGNRTLFPAGDPPPIWPEAWQKKWWKPTDRRRDLVKAGALIVAEMERIDRKAVKAMTDHDTAPARPQHFRPAWFKFKIGDRVRKKRGASWQGEVCGYYQTSLTSEGYAVESEREPGSVQIYPVDALEAVPDGQ